MDICGQLRTDGRDFGRVVRMTLNGSTLETTTGAEPATQDSAWFEPFLIALASRFISLPTEQIDSAIADAQRQVCRGLHLDRSTLWQWSRPSKHLTATHMHTSVDRKRAATVSDSHKWADRDWTRFADNMPTRHELLQMELVYPW